MGWVESCLCPTLTWPEWFGWMKVCPETNLDDLVRFFDSGLVGFGLYRVGLGFNHRGRYLARSSNIWPDLSRFGQNLAGFVEIWLRFCQIMVRSHRILKDLDQISMRSRRIWSEMLNISPKILKLSVRVEFHRFWNGKSTTDPLGSG